MQPNSLQKAIELVEKGQVEEGLGLLKEMESTLHDEEKFLLAEKYYEWGNPELSLSILIDLHLLYPEETDITLLLADVYIDLEMEDEAIKLLEEISLEDDAYPQALLLQADLYQMQGLQEVTEQKLREAKRLLPDEPIIDFALGEFYFQSGKDLKAITFYETALKSMKTAAGVQIEERLAEALSSAGRFEDALPYYEKVNEDELSLHSLFSFGVTALQAGHAETAIDKLTKLKEYDPDYSSLYLVLAKAYEQEEMLKESLETAREGLKVDELNKDLYLFGGKMALKNHLPEEAERLLREGIAIDPGHAEAVLALAGILLQSEKYEEVIELMEEVMRFGEEDPHYFWHLGKAYNETEDYSKASDNYQKAYRFFSDEQDFLVEYAAFLVEEGDRQQAAALLRKALEMDPSNVEIQANLMRLEDDFLS
ncbi:tetratricopeptide repeat protein [Metabacillus sp. GX 13764]|uniref:tetratricopeptide repeat protein n=1 Tax=Metabacillus kandeliae TaxID=2900151 RepID=UPI001E36ECDD|nr:tetratricopeptide repeat protein [Metabacillus kandeliae]MCD7033378.1 tetratricopeptide repeat protein [Metabacillus kandeliae]